MGVIFMNKLLIFLLSLLAVSLEAATITNWGSQLPTAAPVGSDVILMQKGGVTYYFTPNQLAANIATNAAGGGITNKIGNLNGRGTNTVIVDLTVSNALWLPSMTPGATNAIFAGDLPLIRVFQGIAGPSGQAVGYNIFVGGAGNTTLSNNTAIAEGTHLVGVGFEALKSNTWGNTSVAIGYRSLYYNTIGYANNAIGIGTLYHNTSGAFNTAMGDQSLYSNITGSSNTAYGDQSAFFTTTGFGNTALGRAALTYNSVGSYNTAIGENALYFSTNTVHNVAVGKNSQFLRTSGDDNTSVGTRSLLNNLTGTDNVVFGNYAGAYETGSATFYVNNQNRVDTAGDKSGSLFYGTFNATPSLQTLVLNARVAVGTAGGAPLATMQVSNTVGSTTRPILQAGTNASSGLTVTTNGYVAIGSSTAITPLHISGNDQEFARLRIQNTGSGGVSYDLVAGIANIGQQGFSIFDVSKNATRLVLATNGWFGIGTLTPSSSLDITGQVRFASAIITNSVSLLAKAFSAPASTAFTTAFGAHLWSDGTNLCVVLEDSAGGRTTNKISMTAWP